MPIPTNLQNKPSRFNPCPPNGRRLPNRRQSAGQITVTIHAPRMGGDRNIWHKKTRIHQILVLHHNRVLTISKKSPKRSNIQLLRCNLPANLTAISCALRVRKARFQVINVPSRSTLSFVPTCSTRLRHSLPR